MQLITVDLAQFKQMHGRIKTLEAFADKAWKLSIAAQAELDNGDNAEVNGRLVEIAEAASAALRKIEAVK